MSAAQAARSAAGTTRKKRRPSLTARMADQLERTSFALTALLASISTDRPAGSKPEETYPLSPHEGYRATVARLSRESMVLVAEHQKRGG